jgi:T-complex protein 1 subunit delta
VIDPKVATNVDLSDIRVVKKLGGTVEDTELVNGLVFTQKVAHTAGGPSRITDAKIGLIQFCLSPPKTNVITISVSHNQDGIQHRHFRLLTDGSCFERRKNLLA